jgi:CRP-like cAMP-binding protein
LSVVPLPDRSRLSRRGEPARLPAAHLLDRDEDLGRCLTPARAVLARRQVRAPVTWIERGSWDPAADRVSGCILVLEGMLLREVVVADDVAAELLGPGDYLPVAADEDRLLPSFVRWTAIARTQVALLGGQFARIMLAFPEIALVLMERQGERADRLTAQQAIAHLNGVERRLLALLWLCADRWGRMTPQGVMLPLALRHDVMAHLVGARRPTVSSAMGRLQRRGAVRPRAGGGWMLLERPEDVSGRLAAERSRPRGSVIFRAEPDDGEPPAAAGAERREPAPGLAARARAARAQSARLVRELHETLAMTSTLSTGLARAADEPAPGAAPRPRA